MTQIPSRLPTPFVILPRTRPTQIVIPGRPGETDFEVGQIVADDASLDSILADVKAEIQAANGSSGQPPDRLSSDQRATQPPDECAFYLSFRFGSRWGIYIHRECLTKIASYLHASGTPRDVAPREAFAHLYAHELFHFAVDVASLILEGIIGTHIGNPSGSELWLPYHKTNNPCHLEEALANDYALKFAGISTDKGTGKIVKDAIFEMMKNQPGGYGGFVVVSDSKVRSVLHSTLLTQIAAAGRGAPVSPNSFIPQIDRLLALPSPSKTRLKNGLPKFDLDGSPLRVFLV